MIKQKYSKKHNMFIFVGIAAVATTATEVLFKSLNINESVTIISAINHLLTSSLTAIPLLILFNRKKEFHFFDDNIADEDYEPIENKIRKKDVNKVDAIKLPPLASDRTIIPLSGQKNMWKKY